MVNTTAARAQLTQAMDAWKPRKPGLVTDALDVDIMALRNVPDGYSEVLTYAEQYCSLDKMPEFPGVVTMRAHDDPYRVLQTICSRWDEHGNRYDDSDYDSSRPYMHPSVDRFGNERYVVPTGKRKLPLNTGAE